MHSLHKQSFGIIMLLLALVAMAPGLSIVTGMLLMLPAFQMITGKAAPIFPRRIAAHPLPAKYLAAVLQRSILRYLEHVVHPRWHTPLEATKRTVGATVFMLSIILVFIPLPLSNVVPALAISLLSLAYLEEDGVLLMICSANRRDHVIGLSRCGLGRGRRHTMDYRPSITVAYLL